VLESALAGRAWLISDTFSAADIMVGTSVRYLHSLRLLDDARWVHWLAAVFESICEAAQLTKRVAYQYCDGNCVMDASLLMLDFQPLQVSKPRGVPAAYSAAHSIPVGVHHRWQEGSAWQQWAAASRRQRSWRRNQQAVTPAVPPATLEVHGARSSPIGAAARLTLPPPWPHLRQASLRVPVQLCTDQHACMAPSSKCVCSRLRSDELDVVASLWCVIEKGEKEKSP
jgi:hypothetical protein